MEKFQEKRENFFKNLKKVRERSEFTQQQLAEKLNISVKQYQKYETKILPPHEKLFSLNEVLKTDLSRSIYQSNVPAGTYALEDDGVYPQKESENEKFLRQRVQDLEKRVQNLDKIIALLERDDGTVKNA